MKTLGQLKQESAEATLLRRHEQAEEDRIVNSIKQEREKQQAQKKSRIPTVQTPGKFIAQTRNRMKSSKSLLVRRKRRQVDIPEDGRLLFVVRIHMQDIIRAVHVDNQIKKALHMLRLYERFHAVLLRATPEVQGLLNVVEPYVTFGEPSQENVERILRKKARVLHNGNEVLLRDNNLIEEKLGEQGIICLEDLIHEIWNTTELFETAINFLRPFRLNFKKFKKTKLRDGGDYGYRGSAINELINDLV